MKKINVLILISLAVITACSNDTNDICDCLAYYEIENFNETNINPTVECLKNNQVDLTLFSEETMNLISEMDSNCPKESRKLWWLCGAIDAGRIEVED